MRPRFIWILTALLFFSIGFVNHKADAKPIVQFATHTPSTSAYANINSDVIPAFLPTNASYQETEVRPEIQSPPMIHLKPVVSQTAKVPYLCATHKSITLYILNPSIRI